MNSTEKEIFYTAVKPYSTLNAITEKTKNVWFVCHGMGYLSRYFIRYFKDLNAEENYIIAPQAPNTYYQSKDFKHVGASWLTKENTETEIQNILEYFNAILNAEKISKNLNLIVFGYSQGVSVTSRFVAKKQLQCSQLVLHSGGIPKELIANDFKFLKAKVTVIYGDKDEYITEERLKYENGSAKELFGEDVNIINFDGIHEVNTKIINDLV
ncbi:Predicted esterase [Flaviramulus basaltis]|uniref:Predicted esterase n=1 Tax=Flaviramulus basaltis TaxID=369401 RepID=A0A1K2IPQ7_9FLAO|nr:esterase [Flaviramulus basaltis]SFZ94242.1 Predicted esterase [Flaviramulus basaltis]